MLSASCLGFSRDHFENFDRLATQIIGTNTGVGILHVSTVVQ